MNAFAQRIMEQKYSHTKSDGKLETWDEIAYRVTKHVFKAVGVTMKDNLAKDTLKLIQERKFIPGGRYLYAAGRPFHQVQNCLLLKAEDSREGWSDLLHKSTMALSTGAGIGIDYSSIRAEGKPIRKTGGFATGPLALMKMTNEVGRGIMQGGSRRSAIWAGLNWSHADAHKFIRMKNWSDEIKAGKAKDYNAYAPMDGTNISVLLDDEFFAAFDNDKHAKHNQAQSIYWAVIRQMLEKGEPGFSVDIGDNRGESLRNACTELTSKDDSDICNIGSINISQIKDVAEMKHAVQIAVPFLLAGTVYSDVPYAQVDKVRTKNRRLGLGLLGLHEWLLVNGKSYGPDEDLGKLLDVYKQSGEIANEYADKWDLSRPIKTRAVAPTGTIGILAESTTGCEPIFCVAYKRRNLKGQLVQYEYVVDPCAKRLIDSGKVDSDKVEDAYTISPDRRVAFQAWLQQYVDHGISSTINLPSWGSEANNENKVQEFGRMLYGYLPKLRGITVYPDGAISGQPLTPVKYVTAIKHLDQVFIEAQDICDLTKGGSCGS